MPEHCIFAGVLHWGGRLHVSDFFQRWVQRFVAWEFSLLLIFSWLAFISIPLALGEMGISWDALNHHIYLGWTAEHPRFDQDLFAASGQTFQYPYLYWPVYKLSQSGLPGKWAGVVLATLHWTIVPPVWMIARCCMPGKQGFDVLMRFIAVVLAFMTGVVLSMFDSTSNDLLAAVPLVWALAQAMKPLCEPKAQRLALNRSIILSGLCAGVSVAFKLSNGPLVILLPGLWLLAANSLRQKMLNVLVGCLAVAAGFSLAYGYWGWQLWSHFGNPIYPFDDHWFVLLRVWLGRQA